MSGTRPRLPYLSRTILFLSLLSSFCSGLRLTASEVVVLKEKRQSLGPFLSIYEDETGLLSINDIISPKYAPLFKPQKKERQAHGLTRNVLWIKVVLKNPDRFERQWNLEVGPASLNRVNLYIQQPNNAFQIIEKGDRFPFSSREPAYIRHLFPLTFKPDQIQTIYFEIASTDELAIYLKAFTPEAFVEDAGDLRFFLGFYFGLMTVMGLYNLFIFISVRDKSYFYYVVYIAGLVLYLFCFEGLAFQYFWPDNPIWNDRAAYFFGGLGVMAACAFSKSFLRTHIHARRTNLALSGIIALGGLVSLTSFFGFTVFAQYLGYSLLLCMTVIIMTAGFQSWRKGYRPAVYFLAAWTVLLAGLSMHALVIFGLIKSSPHFVNAIFYGSASEAILLSLGLASRINELKSASNKAQRNMRLAEQANALKDEFLATTSHELRTPLHGMIGLLESVVGGTAGQLPQKAKNHLQMVLNTGQRLAYLINDILDFSKLKNKSLSMKKGPVDLHSLTSVVLALSEPLASSKHIALSNKVSPRLPHVHADEVRLQQILHNLVGNAVKFTETGGVTVTAAVLENQVEVSVIDTGIGIPKSQLNRIFKPYLQAEGVGAHYGGTGLGLAVVRQLVELHKGRIDVESTEGNGTVFRFTLPTSTEQVNGESARNERPEITVQENLQATTPVQETAPTTNFRILIVDDEPVNRLVLKEYLAADYHLSEAVNGLMALEMVENQGPFDLVLLDIMMPGLSGYDVCRSLRRHYPASELPVIFLTARDRVEDIVSGFEVQANDYLIKPISRKELLPRVKSHLQFLDVHRNMEEKVKERTRLIQTQKDQLTHLNSAVSQRNKQLKLVNQELDALVDMIQSMNEQQDLDDLMADIVNHSLKLFPNTEKAVYLSLHDGGYHAPVAIGFKNNRLEKLRIEKQDMLDTFYQSALKQDQDVYIPKQKGIWAISKLLTIENYPQSMLVMSLTSENQLLGLLILIQHAPRGYENSELPKMLRFRQHALTAMIKLQRLQQLEGVKKA